MSNVHPRDLGTGSPLEDRPRTFDEVLAFLTVALAILGMFLSAQRFAGPDENVHQATAWVTIKEGLPPVQESLGLVPGIIPQQPPCFAFDPSTDTGCIGPREELAHHEVRVVNYPPLYYWAVGSGQRIMSSVSDAWIDYGGRLASLLLNLATLLMAALTLRRFTRQWGTYILLVSPPMAVFLWAVVNPSGWEIAMGVLFITLFARAWWGLDPRVSMRRQCIEVGLAGIAFGLSRHDALVWLILLVISVVLMGRSLLTRRRQVTLVSLSLLGVAAGGFWQMTRPAQHPLWNLEPVTDPGFIDYASWLSLIDDALFDRVRQMYGVLGWLDTEAPQGLLVLLIAGWMLLIGVVWARTRFSPLVLLIGFIGSVIVPTAMELLRWNDWPYWYQGRITLPFIVPFLLALLIRFGHTAPKPTLLLSLASSIGLAVMVWLNLMRNSFALNGLLPRRWSAPSIDSPSFWGACVCIVLIVVIAAFRARALKTRSPVAQ